MFRLISKYYSMGIYSDADVDMYVRSGDITAVQGELIKAGRQTSNEE